MATAVDACTVDHLAIKVSPEWGGLELRGYQDMFTDEDGPATRHEVRNCRCGTTLYKRAPFNPRELQLIPVMR